MSNKSLDGREIDNATPEQMREELDKYFAHVQQHDPKNLKFTIMVAGHDEEDGDIHVSAMVSGPPQTIAYGITELIDGLVKRNPAFAVFFLAYFLRRMNAADVEVIAPSEIDFNNTGGADVEAQVKSLIDKLRSGTPPSGSVH